MTDPSYEESARVHEASAAAYEAKAPARGQKPSAPVVRILLLVNIGVSLMWMVPAIASDLLADNLMVSWSLLMEGRVWVLLTSVFSHNLVLHFLVNMIVLLSFGPPTEQLMGSRAFLRFFLLAGVLASVAHATTSAFLLDQPGLRALGASGALAGVLMLFSLSFPKAKVLLFFVIPLPAIVAALAFVAIDIWGLVAQMGGGTLPIGHGAHLGGGLVGVVYYLTHKDELRARRSGARTA